MSKRKAVTPHEAATTLGALGGKARARNLSPAELTEIGKAGGAARAAALSPAQRSAIAKKAVRAREARRKASG